MAKNIAGYWRKKSEGFQDCFDYMYIDQEEREVISSVIISLYPLKSIHFLATLDFKTNGKIFVQNKKTGDTRENYYDLKDDNLNWSVDGINFRLWEKISYKSLDQIPQQMMDMINHSFPDK
jgi:hypothetical protein